MKLPELDSYCGGSSTWKRQRASHWVDVTDGKTWFKGFVNESGRWFTLPHGMNVIAWRDVDRDVMMCQTDVKLSGDTQP